MRRFSGILPLHEAVHKNRRLPISLRFDISIYYLETNARTAKGCTLNVVRAVL